MSVNPQTAPSAAEQFEARWNELRDRMQRAQRSLSDLANPDDYAEGERLAHKADTVRRAIRDWNEASALPPEDRVETLRQRWSAARTATSIDGERSGYSLVLDYLRSA